MESEKWAFSLATVGPVHPAHKTIEAPNGFSGDRSEFSGEAQRLWDFRCTSRLC
jgi:hypothetical protein